MRARDVRLFGQRSKAMPILVVGSIALSIKLVVFGIQMFQLHFIRSLFQCPAHVGWLCRYSEISGTYMVKHRKEMGGEGKHE